MCFCVVHSQLTFSAHLPLFIAHFPSEFGFLISSVFLAPFLSEETLYGMSSRSYFLWMNCLPFSLNDPVLFCLLYMLLEFRLIWVFDLIRSFSACYLLIISRYMFILSWRGTHCPCFLQCCHFWNFDIALLFAVFVVQYVTYSCWRIRLY